MRTLVSVFLCFVAFTNADDSVNDEHVLVLTDDNFKDIVDQNEFVLAEFYAPWCGHCKALAPEYANAAAELQELGSPIKLGKVDATVHTKLAEQFEVKGYPTLKFFKNGTPKEYGGGRTAKEIVSWLIRNSGPPTKTLTTVQEAKDLVEREDVVLVGYFEELGSLEAMAYIAAADGMSDSSTFGITTDKTVIEGMEADVNTVVLYKKFDEGKIVYSGDWHAEGIGMFIKSNELPLVVTFSEQIAPKIFGGDIRTHFLVFFPGTSDKIETYLADLRTVAQGVKGKVLIVHINTDGEESERIMEFFSITKDDVPSARLIDMGEDMKKFVPDFTGLDPEKVKAFLDSFIAGELQPHLNTEDVPSDWDKESVVVLVGKNFKEIALDQSKHVFVEFYAPWCGHCKQLAPIWEELGNHFKDDDDVVIAKMDSTKNEVAEVQIQGFPTLKFFPKGSTEVVDYDGGRTLDDLVKYIEARMGGADDDEGEGDEGEGEEGEGEDNDDEDNDDEEFLEEEPKKDEL